MNPLLGSHEMMKMAGYLAAGIVVYFVLVALYRISPLHPLSKYPGPFLEKISGWPLIFHCYKGDRYLSLQKAHEKYGSVVRTGPNALSFNTASALQSIYSNRSANVWRSEWYRSIDTSYGASSINSCMDRKEHSFRRRIMRQAFSERALEDADALIADNVAVFCDRLGLGAEHGEWTPPKNLADWVTYFAFDFASDLAFGRPLGLMVDPQTRYIPKVLMGASQFLSYVGYLPFAALVRPFMGTAVMNYVGGKAAADSLKLTNLIQSRLAERLEAETQARKSGQLPRKDALYYILGSRDPDTGREFTKGELEADIALIFGAGSDGVAFTISACLFYLLRNPPTLTRLTCEIRSAFAHFTDIRHPQVSALPYLHACVEETLRVSPPVPSSLPRLVLPGGLTINDGADADHNHGVHVIPAGTVVGVPAYALHHNEAYYRDSWTFRPERWIVSPHDGVTAQDVARARKAFCPFSTGPTNCVGKGMAYLAIKSALAGLLWRYDIRMAAEAGPTGGGSLEAEEEGRRRVGEYQILDFLVAYKDGPTVELRARPCSTPGETMI